MEVDAQERGQAGGLPYQEPMELALRGGSRFFLARLRH